MTNSGDEEGVPWGPARGRTSAHRERAVVVHNCGVNRSRARVRPDEHRPDTLVDIVDPHDLGPEGLTEGLDLRLDPVEPGFGLAGLLHQCISLREQ